MVESTLAEPVDVPRRIDLELDASEKQATTTAEVVTAAPPPVEATPGRVEREIIRETIRDQVPAGWSTAFIILVCLVTLLAAVAGGGVAILAMRENRQPPRPSEGAGDASRNKSEIVTADVLVEALRSVTALFGSQIGAPGTPARRDGVAVDGEGAGSLLFPAAGPTHADRKEAEERLLEERQAAIVAAVLEDNRRLEQSDGAESDQRDAA